MKHIILTSEQDALLLQSSETVMICRPDGSVVGIASPVVSIQTPAVCPFSPEEIAAAEAEASGAGPFCTGSEVLEAAKQLLRA